MIIKNLSRSNAGGSGQLVKYIFKYIFKDQGAAKISKKDLGRPLYLPKGVVLNAKDIHHLKAEKEDGKLMADFKSKYPDFNSKAYIQNYLLPKLQDQEKEQKVLHSKDTPAPFVIKHNIRANSLNGFIREFENNELGRIHKRKDQTAIHHTIISFSNRDSEHITEKLLRDVSRQYISLRGKDNLYVGTVHMDRAHIHLHIAMSGTTITGKSSRISKKDFENVKVKLQEYTLENHPQLSFSNPNHGKAGREKVIDEVKKIYRNERTSEKESILQCTEAIFFKATSTEHFVSLLNQSGYKEYYRNEKLTGIQTEKYKYRFTSLGVHLDSLHELDAKAAKEKEALKEIQLSRSKEKRELRRSLFKEEDTKELEPVSALDTASMAALQEIRDARAGRDTGRDMGSGTVVEQDHGDDREDDAKDNRSRDADQDSEDSDSSEEDDDWLEDENNSRHNR